MKRIYPNYYQMHYAVGRFMVKCLIMCILIGGGYSLASAETPGRPVIACEKNPFAFTLKSNVIGWGMLVPNVTGEIEWRRWSAQLPIYYSDLDYFSHRVKFHVFTLQPGVRYWLKDGDHRGHTGVFAGAHLGIAWYNMAIGGSHRIQDHDARTPSLGGGLDLGWRKAFGTEGRWKLELSLGLGAYTMHYDWITNPEHGPGQVISTRKRMFLGMDHIGVSIGYTFDIRRKECRQ